MSVTMPAVRIHGPGDVRHEWVDVPGVGPDEVRIEIAHTGICGTDLHIYDGWQMGAMVTLPNYPAVIGHELAGTIVEVGSAVTTRRVGERVTVQPQVYCGVCVMCERGSGNMCRNKIRFSRGGAWARYMVVHAKQAYLIPDKVSTQLAALSEPLGCALRGLQRARLQPGDTVFVAGGGTIGLLLAALARKLGASLVIVSEPFANRRRIADALGVDLTIDPLNENVAATVAEATGGIGADVCLEAAGPVAAALDCISTVRDGGTIIMMALAHPDQVFAMQQNDLVLREIDVRGTVLLDNDLEGALRLLPQLGLEPLITHVLPLQDAPQAIAMCKRGEATKVLFDTSM